MAKKPDNQKQIKDVAAILEVSKAMMAEKDPDRLLNLIVDKATQVLEAERGSIFLVDFDTKELYSRIAQDVEIAEIRIPWDKGIAGSAVQTRKIINIKDAYQDPRFNKEIDKKTGYRTRNILCGPLINHKDEVIGSLQLLNKKDGSFNDYDESLITAFSAQAAVAIENAQLYQELELTFKSFLKTLSSTLDARDQTTAGHSERVARYALNIARAMGFSEEEMKVIDYAAALHDIGKIAVRDDVLLKPGKLTPEEYKKMQSHAVKTKEILDNMFFSRGLRAIPHVASSHHEKIDGSGYPYGLKESQLSKAARIMAVADVYEALTAADRPYKKAMTPEQAIAILEQGKGTHFDAEIVDVFIKKRLYKIERRKFFRMDATIPLEYLVQSDKKQVDDQPVKTETTNISPVGLIFSSQRSLALGMILELVLHLPEKDLKVRGKVIRNDPKGSQHIYQVGVEFINLAAKQRDVLSGIFLVDHV
ncbi:MAG: GAF domain-containing protein [Planctomycetes bacterium]|nr:GAF domain-containing protein [Planctomycetota bacterium]